MYVRLIDTYKNKKGETRVYVTFQSFKATGKASMFATEFPADAKIGSRTLAKSYTLEKAREDIALGEDFSDTFEWGEQIDGLIHEVKLKS